MSNNAVNLSNISAALAAALAADSNTKDCIIVRSEVVNNDPAQAVSGWIGLYRNQVKYDPHTLGRNSHNYRGSVVINIVVQKTSYESGQDAEEELEDMVVKVADVLLHSDTARGAIEMIEGLTVLYSYNRTKEKSLYFQEAVLELRGTVNT